MTAHPALTKDLLLFIKMQKEVNNYTDSQIVASMQRATKEKQWEADIGAVMHVGQFHGIN